MKGLGKLDDFANKTYNDSFIKLNPQQRHDLLVKLDEEQKNYMKNKKNGRSFPLFQNGKRAYFARIFHFGNRLHPGDAIC